MNILKGQSAEIRVPAKAVFTANDCDDFVVVVKRGNDVEWNKMVSKLRDGTLPDRVLLDEHVIRLEGLTNAGGELIGGNGVLKWMPASVQAVQSGLTNEEAETLAVIDAMMGITAYRVALINAACAGVANRPLFESQRLGN